LTGTPLLDWLRANGTIVNRLTAAVLWGFAATVMLGVIAS